jgi:hypothetical protein
MIKECKVIFSNELVTVIDFEGCEVQFNPAIPQKSGIVKVEYKDGKYTVLPDDYVEEKEIEKPKKRRNKKTTNDENADD